jgi:5-(carboxyamino)imidazole ribonucleotide synthase
MLKPGATIGILGGGQLARMMALAAATLGLKCHIYAPAGDNPAFEVAAASTEADFTDEVALKRFAAAVDVVTYEFENVPARTAEVLAAIRPVHPNPRALAVTQDRPIEKTFVRDLGLPVPDFRAIDSLEDLMEGAAAMGGFGVLKTRRFGYDGKGQAMIRPDTSLAEAWEKVGKAASILEALIPFDRECSVIAARAAHGDSVAYDLCENEHRHHILARTTLPASVPLGLSHEAMAIGETIAAALDYVGVIAVELFVAGDRLLVNEIAPRVHNSGHWTIEGAETSQFENHIRAVAGWPLGIARRRARIVMDNLIGDEAERWEALLAEPGAHLHLYGKAESRPGRKMGHVTRLLPENA